MCTLRIIGPSYRQGFLYSRVLGSPNHQFWDSNTQENTPQLLPADLQKNTMAIDEHIQKAAENRYTSCQHENSTNPIGHREKRYIHNIHDVSSYTIDKSSLNRPRAAGQTHNRPTWSTRHKEDNPVSKPCCCHWFPVSPSHLISFAPGLFGCLVKKATCQTRFLHFGSRRRSYSGHRCRCWNSRGSWGHWCLWRDWCHWCRDGRCGRCRCRCWRPEF